MVDLWVGMEGGEYEYFPVGTRNFRAIAANALFQHSRGPRAILGTRRAMQTLKDNWIWIAAPIVLFSLIVLAMFVFSSGGAEAPDDIYHLR